MEVISPSSVASDFSLLLRGEAEEITPCLPTLHRKLPISSKSRGILHPLKNFMLSFRDLDF